LSNVALFHAAQTNIDLAIKFDVLHFHCNLRKIAMKLQLQVHSGMSIKIPLTPPDLSKLFQSLRPERLGHILAATELKAKPSDYLHWDKLFHKPPPEGFSSEEWWLAVKMARISSYKAVPLHDRSGAPFKYLVPDSIQEELYKIDQSAGGGVGVSPKIINPGTRTQYYVSSLIEEAITSSQLEGAATTRAVAKQMIRENRSAVDRGEQMILNNYAAMQRIGEIKEAPLTKDLVLELQSILTADTLDNPSARGRFRLADEDIVVQDKEGMTYHIPPPAHELDRRMLAMCAFANGEIPGYFIHPVLRSIILHFWLAYDHPFVDGNGRTARALFYWSMLHCGFWLCEYISISHIIRRAPVKYVRAFLLTETDDNDLTYFLLYHIEVLREAFDELDKYILRKSATLKIVEQNLKLRSLVNRRQMALLSHALRHPGAIYTTKGHQTSHRVSFHTARADLMGLVSHGYLKLSQVGRTTLFEVPKDIEARLASG
jgi:Fic family protein